MSLNTIGSIASFIAESFSDLPSGVSGNLVIISDMARQHVANYVGINIGSNSIGEAYQPAIVDFAKADAIDMAIGYGNDDGIKLAELSVEGGMTKEASKSFRMMGESKLRALGQVRRFARSLS